MYTEIKISNGYSFGFDFGLGMFLALVVAVLGSAAVNWGIGKLSSSQHKPQYEITSHGFTTAVGGETVQRDVVYLTEAFDRKLNGQIVFFECTTGDEVTLQPNRDIVIHKVVEADKVQLSCAAAWKK